MNRCLLEDELVSAVIFHSSASPRRRIRIYNRIQHTPTDWDVVVFIGVGVATVRVLKHSRHLCQARILTRASSRHLYTRTRGWRVENETTGHPDSSLVSSWKDINKTCSGVGWVNLF